MKTIQDLTAYIVDQARREAAHVATCRIECQPRENAVAYTEFAKTVEGALLKLREAVGE